MSRRNSITGDRIAASDRFIPSRSSHQAYHALEPPTAFANAGDVFNFSLREDSFPMPPTRTSGSPLEDGRETPAPPDTIAEALGLTSPSRVYTFSPAQTAGRSPSDSPRSVVFESSSPLGFGSPRSLEANRRKARKVETHVPFRVLDAPGLRNDFYTNLISWSALTGKVAVGLNRHVYLWSESGGATPLGGLGEETITCVKFASRRYLAVGTRTGRVMLYDETTESLYDQHLELDGKGAVCMCWMIDGLGFFCGNDNGEVIYYAVDEGRSGPRLVVRCVFKCHQQQICGIAISSDGNQITVGGNDNCCTIWNVRNLDRPVLQYTLAHKAAVKAIAYCPWSKSLLATGGGSKDRTIRFWHTNSGTLLDKHRTSGQVTSLIWSLTTRQLVASFGFGDLENPVLVTVFQYPKMTPVLHVPATINLRALSAVASPDCGSVCVATNDETVRFYELWSPKRPIFANSQQGGVLGSDIIELSEGMEKDGSLIR